ncbi:MAG: translation initiation factor IF-2 subunit beta [Candidatus Woesearchaeota archaeon]
MNYEEMLERGKKKLPDFSENTERFIIPQVSGHLEGNKTVINNFFQIASAINRDPDHLLKYLLKELATPGEFKKQLLVLGSKVPSQRINEKIEKYIQEFVICKECGKPDTKLSKEEGVYFIKCQACGARHSIYSRI